MLKRLKHVQTCCSGELSSQDKINFEVFVVSDAFSVHSPKDFVLCSCTINSTTKKRGLHYIVGRERCNVLLQKDFRMTPKGSKDFNMFVFVQLVNF